MWIEALRGQATNGIALCVLLNDMVKDVDEDFVGDHANGRRLTVEPYEVLLESPPRRVGARHPSFEPFGRRHA